ncbi:formate/nitrite transporter family protein [Arcanobacterium ihumii]|uniref:formate/nitrite transporter family protein n=1 Tax=Arcanobacterium ihumii TaxID=2138162 RepID=UPI000F52214E|nr:formate/nitrite transporter family protein [Arcanobacterium ihumii]
MISLNNTLSIQMKSGRHKAHEVESPGTFIISTMLAGALIGVADIAMFTTAGPFYVTHAPAAMLIAGLSFGVGLILVVTSGSNLATSAMMALPQAATGRLISWKRAAIVLLLVFLGNLIGAIFLSLIMSGTHVFHGDTAAQGMLEMLIVAKAEKSSLALFTRGIMCNVLVCFAIWSQSRTKNDAGKMIIIFLCVAAFISSGFEHVVANMTTFSLGLFHGIDQATLLEAARNFLFVGLGNLVGGGVIVGGSMLALSGSIETAAHNAHHISDDGVISHVK